MGAGNWSPTSWITRYCLSCMVNNTAADVLVMQGTMASAAVVLTHFFLNKIGLANMAPEKFIY